MVDLLEGRQKAATSALHGPRRRNGLDGEIPSARCGFHVRQGLLLTLGA